MASGLLWKSSIHRCHHSLSSSIYSRGKGGYGSNDDALGTAQATLYNRVIECGLGSAVTGGGLSDELLQATFAVGLKGVQPENNMAVEALVMDTLEDIVKEGSSDDDIASVMNTVEFRLQEFNTGSFPKGLSFMLGAMSKWIYDGSPTDALHSRLLFLN